METAVTRPATQSLLNCKFPKPARLIENRPAHAFVHDTSRPMM
jgi:hypothetical protein